MSTFFMIIGAFVLLIALITYSTVVGGLIFYKFYYWFLLPVFTEMPEITFSMALGLSFFAVVFKNITIDELDDSYKDSSKKWIGLIYPWILLLAGWITKLIIYS